MANAIYNTGGASVADSADAELARLQNELGAAECVRRIGEPQPRPAAAETSAFTSSPAAQTMTRPALPYRWWSRLLEFLGDFQFGRPRFDLVKAVAEIERRAEPGDVLAGRSLGLAARLIPSGRRRDAGYRGSYTHTGLVVPVRARADTLVGPGWCASQLGVVEATSEGIRPPRPIWAFVAEERAAVGLFRPRWSMAARHREAALAVAERLVGTDYDYTFRPGLARAYCHEFVAECLRAGGLTLPERRITAGDVLAVYDRVWEVAA